MNPLKNILGAATNLYKCSYTCGHILYVQKWDAKRKILKSLKFYM